jgi:anti-sigma regulatory factor (Ser/Thr protein kinase)
MTNRKPPTQDHHVSHDRFDTGNTIELSRDPADLVRMRAWLTKKLTSEVPHDGRVLEDAVVMASELVTNVIMHTHSVPVLTAWVEPDEVRIAVHDDDPRPPVVEPMDARRPRGNGLRIVDEWADGWGSEIEPGDGKIVWFALRS